MPVRAKICGLSTEAALDAALDGGAAYVGFVLFAASPRAVSAERAAVLARRVRGRAATVALLVDPDDVALEAALAGLRPDLLQLHGRETPARVAEIRRLAGEAGLIKVLPVSRADDLAAAAAYDGLVDHLMFDAKPPKDADRPGGHGAAFDWSLLAGRRFQRPWFLAGGLDPWNLGEAVAASGAPLVDVSTGVERGPGLKDAALISAFLDAARRA